MIPGRYFALIGCALAAAVGVFLALRTGVPTWWGVAAIFGFLTAVGIRDLTQTRQSIRRNYPILAHMRFLMEAVRPEIRQYLLESDTDESEYSNHARASLWRLARVQPPVVV